MNCEIRNAEYRKQSILFSGLQWGGISPTDIDGFLDYKGRAFVWFEIKYDRASLKRGQELAYERLADACEKAGVKTLIIFAHHMVRAPGDVYAAELPVKAIRFQGGWIQMQTPHTVRDVFDRFLKWVDGGADKTPLDTPRHIWYTSR